MINIDLVFPRLKNVYKIFYKASKENTTIENKKQKKHGTKKAEKLKKEHEKKSQNLFRTLKLSQIK